MTRLSRHSNSPPTQVITLNPSFHKTAIATNASAFLRKSWDALDTEEKVGIAQGGGEAPSSM